MADPLMDAIRQAVREVLREELAVDRTAPSTTDDADDERLLTTEEAAEIIRMSKSSLARWRAEGTGPAYVLVGGRAVRYRRADVDAWMADRTAAA